MSIETRISALASRIGLEFKTVRGEAVSVIEEVGTITKNTNYPISATKKIASVTVYDPVTFELKHVPVKLAADRLSGNINLGKTITNAQISIITE